MFTLIFSRVFIKFSSVNSQSFNGPVFAGAGEASTMPLVSSTVKTLKNYSFVEFLRVQFNFTGDVHFKFFSCSV